MLSCFSLSSPVFAGGLSDDMKVLGKNYKAFNQAENPQAATAALNNMRAAAVHSKQYKLASHSAEKFQLQQHYLSKLLLKLIRQKHLFKQVS